MPELSFRTNELLGALDGGMWTRFSSRFQLVELQRGDVLCNLGQPVERVHFPLNGLVAVLSETVAGETLQTGMVGCDGAVGASEALGRGLSLAKCVVQIPGWALRIEASQYRELYEASHRLRQAAQRFQELQLAEARQFGACNALHPVEARLSRSILEALERSCRDRILPLTQDALAQMIGAQRTTVSVFLSKLQRAGYLKNSRGALEVLNPRALERTACSCRATLQFARGEVESSAGWRELPLHGSSAGATAG